MNHSNDKIIVKFLGEEQRPLSGVHTYSNYFKYEIYNTNDISVDVDFNAPIFVYSNKVNKDGYIDKLIKNERQSFSIKVMAAQRTWVFLEYKRNAVTTDFSKSREDHLII